MGVGPDDAELMTRYASRVYDSIWERMGDLAQYRAMYRGLSLLLIRRRKLSLFDDVGQSFDSTSELGKTTLAHGGDVWRLVAGLGRSCFSGYPMPPLISGFFRVGLWPC